MPDDTRSPDGRDEEKKPYVEPKLVEYGSVSKLTEAQAAGSFTDAMARMMNTCL
jgi:hypothetical protein